MYHTTQSNQQVKAHHSWQMMMNKLSLIKINLYQKRKLRFSKPKADKTRDSEIQENRWPKTKFVQNLVSNTARTKEDYKEFRRFL